MERAIVKGLGVKPELAKAFIKRAGSDERAAEIILGWTDETRPTYVKKLDREWIERGRRASRLRVWAEKHGDGAKAFVAGATLFELTITMEHNPTYPSLCGFRVSLDACIDLSKMLEYTLIKDQIGYAVAVEGVLNHRSITKEQYEIALTKYGLTFIDPVLANPFPVELFMNHPLRREDPDDIGIQDVIAHGIVFGGPYGNAVDMVRERRNMQNRLSMERDEEGIVRYKLREGAAQLVRMIRALNRAVT